MRRTIILLSLFVCIAFVYSEVVNPFEHFLGANCPYKTITACTQNHLCSCRNEDLSGSDNSIVIEDVTISPFPIVIGTSFDISFTVSSKYELLNPVIALNIYGVFSINTLTYNICEIAVEKGEENPCPFPAVTRYQTTQTIDLPSNGLLIPATYCGYAVISDEGNARGCTGFVLTLTSQ